MALSIGIVGLYALIREAHRLLGLQSFFTHGPKEARAWTAPVGATVPEAPGVSCRKNRGDNGRERFTRGGRTPRIRRPSAAVGRREPGYSSHQTRPCARQCVSGAECLVLLIAAGRT